MLRVGELFASIRLDDKDFNRGVDQAGSRFGGLVGGVTKGGLLIAGALTGVGVAAGGLAFKAGSMASDLNESISKVQVVFGDLGDSVVNSMDDAASSMGMSKQAAIEAAGTYGNLFAAMGIGADKNREMSTELVRLSADLASFNNMDPTQVLDALRSGLSGETEPLKRLGVNINQARLEAKALEMGLWDGEGAVSAAAKAQATYALVLQDTALAQGDFERTSDGMANQQRILKATMEDAFAAIGQAVIPIIEAILPQLVAGLQGVGDWVAENGPAIQAVIEEVFAAVGEVIVGLAEVTLPLLAAGFGFLSETVLPVLAEAFAVLVNDILPALAEVVTLIIENLDILGPAFVAMGAVLLATVIPSFVAWAVAAGTAAAATVIALAPVLVPIAAIGLAVAGLGLIWREWGDEIGGIVDTVTGAIGDAFEGMGNIIGTVWDGIVSGVKGAINAVIGVINGFIGAINSIQIHIPAIGVGPVQTPRFDWGGLGLGYIPQLAAGTRNFRGGLAIVGEQGPELVQMGAGANVFNNRELQSMLGGRGGNGDVTVQMTVQPREVVDAYDIGLEARRAVRFGLRRQAALRGAGA